VKITQNIKVSVDAVVFGYSSGEGLSILFIKRKIDPFKGSWALPGGLVLNEESLKNAVERELEEESGVKITYLEQLYSFGQPNRDPRNRVLSVAYFGLVRPSAFRLRAATDAMDAAWFPIKDLPNLAFDHIEIVTKAIQRLKAKITYSAVLDRPIDRRNFKKKIMKFGFLIETDEKQKLLGSGRPGNLFKFDESRYFKLVKEGINFEV
jgi:8-oxo-dGTP diphosphatase